MTPNPEYTIEELLHKIHTTWGDYDDFKNGGYEYVAYVISQDLQDMKDDQYDDTECAEELADICINALRMLSEQGYDPTKQIHDRLETHAQRNPEQIITKYKNNYQKTNK